MADETPAAIVPEATLRAIQGHFHAVIRARAGHLVDEHGLTLPTLTLPLPPGEQRAWFPIPGMAGGFAYHIEGEGLGAMLVAESWCRMVWGSEERHEITAEGSRSEHRDPGVKATR